MIGNWRCSDLSVLLRCNVAVCKVTYLCVFVRLLVASGHIVQNIPVDKRYVWMTELEHHVAREAIPENAS